jgi:hypothetical protein
LRRRRVKPAAKRRDSRRTWNLSLIWRGAKALGEADRTWGYRF